jgi:hypothetical protein
VPSTLVKGTMDEKREFAYVFFFLDKCSLCQTQCCEATEYCATKETPFSFFLQIAGECSGRAFCQERDYLYRVITLCTLACAWFHASPYTLSSRYPIDSRSHSVT